MTYFLNEQRISKFINKYLMCGNICFSAANISKDMLPSLTKEDLRDLFPGPEHFLRRRTIWRLSHDENEVMIDFSRFQISCLVAVSVELLVFIITNKYVYLLYRVKNQSCIDREAVNSAPPTHLLFPNIHFLPLCLPPTLSPLHPPFLLHPPSPFQAQDPNMAEWYNLSAHSMSYTQTQN